MMTQPPAAPASDHHPKKKTTSTPGAKQAASQPIPTRRAPKKPPTTKPASFLVIKAESRPASPSALSSASKKQLSREPRETVPHHAQPHQKRKGRRNARRGLWLSIGATVAAVVGLMALFLFLGLHATNTSGAYPVTAADPTVMKEITTISPSVLAAVGAGQTQTKPTRVSGASSLRGPTGKPEVFYYGAEYCPYCAAERWPLLVALSRFGSFSHLSQTTSSSTDVYPSTPTFSFYHSTYTSQYLDFVSLEVESYQHVSLETPTADEQQIINQYNSGESFPFIDVANQYTIMGASYDPQVLSNLDWQQIAGALAHAQSPITQSILGPANYLTAAICAATNQQPASVCQAAPIPQVQPSLSGSTGDTGTPGNLLPVPVAVLRSTTLVG